MARTTPVRSLELYTDGQKWPMASYLRSAIYTEHRLPVCPSRLIKIDDKTRAPGLDEEVLRMLLCAKHMDWRDENEWRLIMLASTADAAADRLVPLPRSAIARVFLGPRISAEDEAAITNAARNHEPAILQSLSARRAATNSVRKHHQGAEIITDYAQLQYWEKRQGRVVGMPTKPPTASPNLHHHFRPDGNTPAAYECLEDALFVGRKPCMASVKSGGITIGFVDFAVFLFKFDRVRCASVGSFLVRNWCGHACSCRRAGIDIRRSPSPNSLHDDHQADRLSPSQG